MSMSMPLKPLKWYKELADRKSRLAAGAFLVEGDRAIRQIIASRPSDVIEIVAAAEPPPELQSYPLRLVTESQLHAVSQTRTPQGIVAVVRLPVEACSGELPPHPGDKVLLLEDIQDPGNVGTLVRTAAAFDYSGVILSEKCADPFAPKCVQAAAGTVLSLWLRRAENYLGLAGQLRDSGYFLVAAELGGREEPSVLRRGKLLLALGNEGAGLSPSLLGAADYRLRIPVTREKAESLNVAACGAICMYLSCRDAAGTS
ncbi:MAG: RNA methyltransferase [Chloroflexota bacterium]